MRLHQFSERGQTVEISHPMGVVQKHESNVTHVRYTVHPFIIANMQEKSNGDTVNEHMPFNTTV